MGLGPVTPSERNRRGREDALERPFDQERIPPAEAPEHVALGDDAQERAVVSEYGDATDAILLHHAHHVLDLVVDRRELKATLARALRFMRATAAAAPEPAPALAGATGDTA